VSATASRSQVLLDLRRWGEAERAAAQEISRDPEDVHARCRLALARFGAGRHAEALEAAEGAIGLDPEEEWGHRLRALALNRMGRRKEAVRAAEESVRLEPDLAATYEVLADCLMSAKQLARAREVAERGIERDPSNAGLHLTLGNIALDLGQLPRAEEHFRVALRHDPEDAVALNNLAVALRGRGKETEAAQLFESAARLDPRLDQPVENLASSARNYVNGWAGLVALSFLVLQLVGALARGEYALAVVVGAALVGAFAYFEAKRREREKALSPAVRELLARQSIWQRLEITRWRPWFWLIPSYVWFLLGAAALVFSVVVYLTEPGFELEAQHAVWLGALAVFCLLTGRYARLYGRRRGWWEW
jgi:tetratricopeptide (TPR) repeat protein